MRLSFPLSKPPALSFSTIKNDVKEANDSYQTHDPEEKVNSEEVHDVRGDLSVTLESECQLSQP